MSFQAWSIRTPTEAVHLAARKVLLERGVAFSADEERRSIILDADPTEKTVEALLVAGCFITLDCSR